MNRDPDAPRPPARSQPQAPSASAPPVDPAERWTVGRLLTWTTDYLKRRGAESPRLDAEVLLAQVLGWERVQLYTHFEDEVADTPRAAFRDLVRRRAEGMPVAYLVGRKEFYSLTLQVSPAVLIPRPDSEFVVVEFLARTRGIATLRAVDVGTGSGCLALACAQHHKASPVPRHRHSPEALAVAERNAESLGLADRVEFRQGDLLDPVSGEGPFDVILSNPPYIPTGRDPDTRTGRPRLRAASGP